MIADHLLRAELCCLRKRDLFFEPWCFYHALFAVLHMSAGTINHVSHTVDHAHLDIQIVPYPDLRGLLRDKFRFCCHHDFSGCRLGQLIRQSFPFMFILQIRQHHQFHKSFDKCRFPGTNGPHYAYVDLSSCPVTDILIQIVLRT